MLAGYYTIASGMMTRQKEIDVIGNNLVNLQTPGYRGEELMISAFEQELLNRVESGSYNGMRTESMATMAVVGEVATLFHGGTIKETNRNLDMALNGEGFFNIDAANGTRYLTRNGQFEIDADGYLMLEGVGHVVGTSGQRIYMDDETFTVDTDGTVRNRVGREVDQLLVTAPAEDQTLLRANNGMFQLAGGGQGEAAQGYEVLQKQIEMSNVDMNQEMTDLIEAQRAFQSCSSALQVVDGLNRKAATQLAAI